LLQELLVGRIRGSWDNTLLCSCWVSYTVPRTPSWRTGKYLMSPSAGHKNRWAVQVSLFSFQKWGSWS
jgi:hypothetical protein